MAMSMEYPDGLPHPWGRHSGFNLTTVTHTDVSDSTDPTRVKLPSNFTVLCTGAGHGIGATIVKSFVQAGAGNVIINSRTGSDLDSVEKTLQSLNSEVRVLKVVADVTVEEQVQELAKRARQEFGRLDVLVNNVGTGPEGLIPGFAIDSTSDFKKVLDTNVWSTYLLTHHLLPLLIESDDGAQAIINISSIAVHTTIPLSVSYILTKGLVTKMSQLVHEAHSIEGVVSFSVHPGSVKTAHNDDQADEIQDSTCRN